MPETMQQGESLRPAMKDRLLRLTRNENFALGAILAALIVAFGVMTQGAFFTTTNVRSLLLRSSIRGVASVGQAFVMLSAGIDLSVGGNAILVSCLGASLMSESSRYPAHLAMPLGVLIMVLVGMGIGAGNGVMVSRFRMSPLIVTLAMWQISTGIAFKVTKGGETVRYLPESLAFFGKASIGGVPVPVIIFVAVIIVAYLVLHHTSFGRFVYAIGGSEVSAILSGVKTKRIRFWVYVICGFCAGIAGVIQLSRIMAANLMALYGLEIDTIAAVVVGGFSLLGGRGSIIGVLLGVLILGVVANGMNILGLTIYMQWVVKGVIILVAVTVDARRRR
jgi:ribose/xylose/arabinose/galactoside ABC-type transport system permease subunit